VTAIPAFAANQAIIFPTNVTADYKLTDVEFIMRSVSPPKEYLSQLFKSTASKTGFTFDFHSYYNYQSNFPAGTRSSVMNLNVVNQRCKAIISVGQNITSAYTKQFGDGVYNDYSSYQYRYSGLLHPNRKVPLNRLKVANGQKQEAIHQIELEKAMEACGYDVKHLSNYASNFVLARELSVRGATINLRSQDVECLVNSDTNPPQELLFNHFVAHIRRITVKGQDINLEY